MDRKWMLSVFVGLAASQILPGGPLCATACLSSALSGASCFPTDLGCLCNSAAALAFISGPCLLGACGAADLQSLSAAQSSVCSSFSAGKLTTLQNVAVTSSTTRTSTVAQTPTPALGLGPPPQVQTSTATATAAEAAKTSESAAASSSSAAAGEDTSKPASVRTEGSAAIGLSGVVAGAGAVSLIMWTWQRKKRRAEDRAASKKESIPVDELAAWIRQSARLEEQSEAVDVKDAKDGKDGKDEKRDLKKLRYTGINMTGKDGPIELEVPGQVYELPGTVLRHEFEG